MSNIDKSLDFVIVEACSPIITLLTPLQVSENAEKAVEDLRDSVEKAFVALERRFFECQIPPANTRDVKLAMAAFADEVVMSSSWPFKYDWMAKPLAIEFFGDSAIGQTFFNRLDELRADGDASHEVLQLFYSLLILGFQGKYRLIGYDHLQAYISSFRLEVEVKTSSVARILADNAAPESTVTSRIVSSQSYWVMVAVFAASLLMMSLVYSSKVQDAVSASSEAIDELVVSLF